CRGQPDRADPHLHGVRDRLLTHLRQAQRQARPSQAVRLPRRRPAGGGSPAARAGTRPHRRHGGRRHPGPRLWNLPLGGPGAGNPGTAGRAEPRQGPRNHEHRVSRAAGHRPAAGRVHRRGAGRLPGPLHSGRLGCPPRRARGAADQGCAWTELALERPAVAAWQRPAEYWPALQAATAELEPPFGVISLAALAHNAHTMLDRANGTTIRVASKSVRVRQVLDAVLALPGYRGVLAYT